LGAIKGLGLMFSLIKAWKHYLKMQIIVKIPDSAFSVSGCISMFVLSQFFCDEVKCQPWQ